MLEKILGEIASQALQEAALSTGRELGRELRNFRKVSRGEASWDELTHVQQTMFLGGDRAEYERIRNELRRSHSQPRRPQCRGNEGRTVMPDIDYADLPPSFFDYGSL